MSSHNANDQQKDPTFMSKQGASSTSVEAKSIPSDVVVVKRKREQVEGAVKLGPIVPTAVEEDDYVEAISHIIERDFFPDLKKLKAQTGYLEAIEAGDLLKATHFKSQLDKLRQAQPVPPESKPQAIPEKALELPLDKFQTLYTSEDNSSFEAILEKTNQARLDKYNWVFNKEKNKLLLTGPNTDEQGHQAPRRMLDYLVDIENNPEKAAEKGKIETWRYKPMNHLMNLPPGIGHELVENQRGDPKSLSHSATRFVSQKTTSLTATRTDEERLNTQQVWKEMYRATPSLSQLHRQQQGAEPTSSSDYSYVPATPTLAPNEDVDPSELMTWGMIESTPLLVDSGGDHSESGPRFSMPPTPKREVIGMKLSEKASKAIKKRAALNESSTPKSVHGTPRLMGSALRMASPSIGGTARARLLSPAAQTLLHKSSTSILSQGVFGGSGSNSKLGSTTPMLVRTPRDSLHVPIKKPAKKSDSITDNLLKLS